MPLVEVNPPNQWRTETPGHAGWQRMARATDTKKYFIVSTDSHANEPATLWAERIELVYRDRVPRVIVDEHGVKWRMSEGHRPNRLRDQELDGEDELRSRSGADPEERLKDMAYDGIDAEIRSLA